MKPAYVRESAVSLECEVCISCNAPDGASISFTQLYFLKDLSPPDQPDLITTTLAVGLIKTAHVHESVLDAEGSAVDVGKLRPISRLGGTTYARLLEGFDLERTSWKAARPAYETILGSTTSKGSPAESS